MGGFRNADDDTRTSSAPPSNNSHQTSGRRPLNVDRSLRFTTLSAASFPHQGKTPLIAADKTDAMELQEKFVVLNGMYAYDIGPRVNSNGGNSSLCLGAGYGHYWKIIL